ncbi:MAG: hypothetical protein KC766_18305 [Myxococcales bacterium]|nr:hypothetical protein [Myxococcales bacterium]
MTLESFRIRQRRINVELELQRTGSLKGHVLCPKQVGAVLAEEVQGFLDAHERFLPFFPEGDAQSSVLINRDHLLLVRLIQVQAPHTTRGVELEVSVDELDDEYPPISRRPEGRRRRVRLVLNDEREVSGHIVVAGPLGHTRTQDLLNEAGRFLYFEDADEKSLLVQVSAILVAADVPE